MTFLKKPSILVFVFSISLFCSAYLLFGIQPLFSKMLLPLLGGSPQVWVTAMLFFQSVLLLGYGYAHLSAKFLSRHLQFSVHATLLASCFLVLPFGLSNAQTWTEHMHPALWQMSLMLSTIGLPFFTLASSAPLFQHWFSKTTHKDANSPYFLYAASNIGSLGALLAYPFVIEPLMTLNVQTQAWTYLYAAFACLTVLSIALSYFSFKTEVAETKSSSPDTPWKTRLYWIACAFIPSSLMLGVTHHVTTDIASVPLLWIIPLALYVLTFVFVFAKQQILSPRILAILHGACAVGITMLLYSHLSLSGLTLISLHFIAFFFIAWSMHACLAASKPEASRLTEFYLFMSLGGVLGGLFNAIVAVELFILPIEYPLILGLSCLLRAKVTDGADRKPLFSVENGVPLAIIILLAINIMSNNSQLIIFSAFVFCIGFFLIIETHWRFAFTVLVILIAGQLPSFSYNNSANELIHLSRNYFGLISVYNIKDKDENGYDYRILKHGTTTHGIQYTANDKQNVPLSYYSEYSPLKDVFDYLGKGSANSIGALGLGSGSIACYKHPGRHIDFYEIDPDIVSLAEDPEYFTYLSGCGTPYNIHIGDGRMTIQNKPEQSYDAIILDAFSSDNIPVHLLTSEAFEIFKSKIKNKSGILVYHISNRYLDLEPVISAMANDMGYKALAKLSMRPDHPEYAKTMYEAHYMILHPATLDMSFFMERGWSNGAIKPGISGWSDNYSNIVNIMGNDSERARRMKILKKEKAED
jgi:hypothetical protein